MKDEDYRIKKVGDDFEFLPEEEKKFKLNYERLLNNIKRRENKILSDQEKIKTLKEELREMKKDRTIQFKQLVKYYKEFTPSFTTSISKQRKEKESSWRDGSFQTSGNQSWTMEVRIGKYKKSIYIGTNKEITKYLDLIEGRSNLDNYSEMRIRSHMKTEGEVLIMNRINELIIPIIKKQMVKDLKKNESLDGFVNKKISHEGVKILKKMYLQSEYYEKRKPMNPKLKGKFITYNPGFIKPKKT